MAKKTIFLTSVVLILLAAALSFVSALGTGSVQNCSADSSIVLCLHMNNNSVIGENSTYAVDSSIYKNNGTIRGGVTFDPTGGFIGDGSLIFDGSTGNITIPYTASLNGTNGFTLSSWFKRSQAGVYHSIMSKGWNAASTWNFQIRGDTNQIEGGLKNSSSAFILIVASAPTLNEWTHVALTFNTFNATLYVNGVPIGTKNISGFFTDNRQVTIGWAGGSWFNGSIDDVMIYNRSLSDSQLWQLYADYNGCFTPTASSNYPNSVKLCQGTYYLNGTASGNIVVSGDNVIIDGDGATLIGNWSGETTPVTYGMKITGNNVTIKNLNFKNYYQGINIGGNNVNITNVSIENMHIGVRMGAVNFTTISHSTFINSSYGSVYSNSENRNIDISFNNFIQHKRRAITFETGGNIINGDIYNNSITDFRGNASIGITNYINVFTGGTNINFHDNYGESISIAPPWYTEGYATAVVTFAGVENSTFLRNTIAYSGYGLKCQQGCRNVTYDSNIIINGDHPIHATSSYDITIKNNKCINITMDYDGYNICMDLRNITGLVVENNNMTQLGQGGMFLQQITNAVIRGNSYSFIPDSDRTSYLYRDFFEPRYGIKISPQFKSFFGSTTYAGNLALNSSNITIYNETFDPAIQSFLWTEAAFNINASLPSYKYYAWEYPELIGKIEVYLNPSTEIMNGIDKNRTARNFSMYGRNSDWKIEQHISNSFIGIVNNRRDNNGNNQTTILSYNVTFFNLTNAKVIFSDGTSQINIHGTNQQLNVSLDPYESVYIYTNVQIFSIYNLTSALLTNGTSLCNGSTGLVTGDVNITLAPNQYCYVLDNFNLTENINRQFSPLWISHSDTSPTSTIKHIASNLSDTINVTVILDVTNCNIKNIVYTSDTGTYSSSDYPYSCDSSLNQVTLNLNGIEPSTSSNVIQINYKREYSGSCTYLIEGYPNFFKAIPMVFTLLGVILVLGVVGLLVLTIKNPGWYQNLSLNFDMFSGLNYPWILLTIGILAILAFVSVIVISAMCSI